MISNMMAQLGGKGSDISEDLVRHMILNSIRGYNVKFKEEFGIDIIICCDSRHYWRREVFAKLQIKENKQEKNLHTIGIIYLQSLIKSEMN